MKYYDKQGELIEVIQGIGKPPCFFTGRGGRRVKSKFLPVRGSRKLAQTDLDNYAKSNGLEKATDR